MSSHLSRRRFVQSSATAAAAIAAKGAWSNLAFADTAVPANLLSQFDYGDVFLSSDLHETQLHETHSVLMQLSDDSLLKPLREMAGMPAPGEDLGMESVPTIQVEHLSPDQIRMYVIADNKLADNAGWDKEILAIELQHLTISSEIPDITLTGFEVGEIDLIIQSAINDAGTEDEPDIEIPVAPVTQVGDLWQLANHRILCGSSLEDESYKSLFKGRHANAAFSDPPFNVKIDGHVSGNGCIRHKEFAMASGEMTEAEFTEFLRKSLELTSRYSSVGAVHYICMDWRHQLELLQASKANVPASLHPSGRFCDRYD